MKIILFITTNNHTPWGGSEELWSQTAARLAKEGQVHIHAIVKKWQPEPVHIAHLNQVGVQFTYLPPIVRHSYIKEIIRKIIPVLPPSVLRTPKQTLRTIQPDLVVLSMGSYLSGHNWMQLCQVLEIPYVNIIHLVTELQWGNDAKMSALAQGYQGAKHNFFVSQQNLALASRQLAIQLDNASIVKNPFKVNGQIIPFPSTKDGFHLACPANYFALHKGQDLLLELFATPKWKNRPLFLHLYGKGNHENYFKRFKKNHELQQVTIHGFIKDIEAVWQKSHALILTSRMEGLPLALIEAMLSGRTAIVTNVGGMVSYISDNMNGFVAKAPTLELIDEALERAWQRREEWEDFGLKAAATANELIPKDPVGDFITILKRII